MSEHWITRLKRQLVDLSRDKDCGDCGNCTNDFNKCVDCMKQLQAENTQLKIELLHSHTHEKQLYAENERLRQRVEKETQTRRDAINEAIEYIKENDQLKQAVAEREEALRKCIPFTASNGKQLFVCEFCYEKPHTDDCDFVRLTGGAG